MKKIEMLIHFYLITNNIVLQEQKEGKDPLTQLQKRSTILFEIGRAHV